MDRGPERLDLEGHLPWKTSELVCDMYFSPLYVCVCAERKSASLDTERLWELGPLKGYWKMPQLPSRQASRPTWRQSGPPLLAAVQS